jgi:hypothetical protein
MSNPNNDERQALFDLMQSAVGHSEDANGASDGGEVIAIDVPESSQPASSPSPSPLPASSHDSTLFDEELVNGAANTRDTVRDSVRDFLALFDEEGVDGATSATSSRDAVRDFLMAPDEDDDDDDDVEAEAEGEERSSLIASSAFAFGSPSSSLPTATSTTRVHERVHEHEHEDVNPKEALQDTQRKQRKYLKFALIIFLAVSVLLAIILIAMGGKSDSNDFAIPSFATDSSDTTSTGSDKTSTPTTTLSSSERQDAIATLLRQQLGGDQDSIQSHSAKAALEWMANSDPAQLDPQDPSLSQRFALAILYMETNHGNNSWIMDSQWMTIEGHCDWYGVTCNDDADNDDDEQDLVQELDLTANGLRGGYVSQEC